MGRLAFSLAAACAAACCTAAAVLVTRRLRARASWRRALAVVQDFQQACDTPLPRLRQIVDAMAIEMHAGLASDGGSKLQMLVTDVDKLPHGSEEGICYALDLGGTNFRVLRVELGKSYSLGPRHQLETAAIPQQLMTSTLEDLFDFIASTVKQFADKEGSETDVSVRKPISLGFGFSFPVKQLPVSTGTIKKWTKGFSISNTDGKDISRCLEEALLKTGMTVRVAALVNDTVGTLALGHYYDDDTVAAVMLGTGTNACYLERADAIIKSQGLLTTTGTVVVNMEWGNFWSSHLPRTPYDVALDDESPNPSEQGFEKMISGIYLGDIVRRVLNRMAQESDIFCGNPPSLSTAFALSTPMVAVMHEDKSHDLSEVDRVLKESLQVLKVPLKTKRLVIAVCDTITRRAARLAAAGIVGILKKIGRDGNNGVFGGQQKCKIRRTVVAVEGGLYDNYATFREYLNDAIEELLGEVAASVFLRVVEDGSGIGAALLAAASHVSN